MKKQGLFQFAGSWPTDLRAEKKETDEIARGSFPSPHTRDRRTGAGHDAERDATMGSDDLAAFEERAEKLGGAGAWKGE
jgi:hypothetical protein